MTSAKKWTRARSSKERKGGVHGASVKDGLGWKRGGISVEGREHLGEGAVGIWVEGWVVDERSRRARWRTVQVPCFEKGES